MVIIGAVHLAGPIAKISKGLGKLSLTQCGLTAKGVNQISHSLSLNQSIATSLTHLELSGNNLKDEINVCVSMAYIEIIVYKMIFFLEFVQLPGPA